MAWIILAPVLMNLILVQGRPEVERFASPPKNHTHLDVYANAISRAHYNPWTCNYREEPGYKCLSCSAALHCFPASLALLVQCAGLFPFCRNGYCSRFKTEGCYEDYTFAEGTHGPLRVTTTAANDYSTMLAEYNSPTETSAQITDEMTTVPNIELSDPNTFAETNTMESRETSPKPDAEKDPRR